MVAAVRGCLEEPRIIIQPDAKDAIPLFPSWLTLLHVRTSNMNNTKSRIFPGSVAPDHAVQSMTVYRLVLYTAASISTLLTYIAIE